MRTKYIMSVLLACLLWACDNSDYDFFVSKYYLEVDETAAIGGEKGDKATFEIKANCAWNLEDLPSWVSATPNSGNGNTTITLEATETNPSSSAKRTGTIKVNGANGAICPTITVEQSQSNETIGFPDNVDFDCLPETKKFTLTCRSAWEISNPNKEWLKVTPFEGEQGQTTIEMTVEENRKTSAITGEITITANGGTLYKRVKVTQKAYEPMLEVFSSDFDPASSKNMFVFPRLGKTFGLGIRCSDGWEIEGVPEWITLSKTSSESGGIFQINVTAGVNDGASRSADFLVKNTADNNYYAFVTVTQAAADQFISLLSEPEIVFTANGQEANVILSCSEKPQIIGLENGWVKLKSENVQGTSYTYTFIAERTSSANNSQTILFATSWDEKVAITAIFKPNLQFTDELSVDFKAQDGTIPVTCNQDWDVISSQESWCKVERQGDKVHYLIDQNNSPNSREAVITVKTTDNSNSASCKVVQSGMDLSLSISPATIDAPADGGDYTINVTTPGNWGVNSTKDWIRTEININNPKQVIVHIEANRTLSPRDGEIEFRVPNTDLVEVCTVHQEAFQVELEINPHEINADYQGGEYNVEVVCNTNWGVSSDAEWCRVSVADNQHVAVRVEPNISLQPRQATLTFVVPNTDIKAECHVMQQAFTSELSVRPAELVFSGISSRQEVTVTSNADWEAALSGTAEWCKIEKIDGSFVVEVEDNPTTSPREATIEVKLINGLDAKTVHVMQEAGQPVQFSQPNITNVEKYQFTFACNFTSESEVVEYGICISDANSEPTNVTKSQQGGMTEGEMAFTIDGLTSARKYYARAYAKNAVGISYGPTVEVVTAGSTPNEGDNNPPQPNR